MKRKIFIFIQNISVFSFFFHFIASRFPKKHTRSKIWQQRIMIMIIYEIIRKKQSSFQLVIPWHFRFWQKMVNDVDFQYRRFSIFHFRNIRDRLFGISDSLLDENGRYSTHLSMRLSRVSKSDIFCPRGSLECLYIKWCCRKGPFLYLRKHYVGQ